MLDGSPLGGTRRRNADTGSEDGRRGGVSATGGRVAGRGSQVPGDGAAAHRGLARRVPFPHTFTGKPAPRGGFRELRRPGTGGVHRSRIVPPRTGSNRLLATVLRGGAGRRALRPSAAGTRNPPDRRGRSPGPEGGRAGGSPAGLPRRGGTLGRARDPADGTGGLLRR